MNDTTKTVPAAMRWIIWFLISFAMFGNYYIYDSISPLADLLKSQLGFSDANIGWLNAIYSFPNIVMVLAGGIIIDRIGTRKSVLLFTFLIMLGSIVTALTGSFWMMAFGRLIFGMGAESMIVAITTIIARWFKGKELSFAFGLNLTVARMGSFFALNSPTWGKSLYATWQSPLFVTVAAGIFAFVLIAAYYVLDNQASKKYNLPHDGKQDAINFSELLSFHSSFWYITALCVTFYSAMFPFQTFAIKFFQEAHGTSREVGGNLSSLLILAAMIFTPLFGLLSDKIGHRAKLMFFGSLLIVPVYLLMAYKIDLATPFGLSGTLGIRLGFFGIDVDLPMYLIIPMSIMGVAFSLIPAIMWPSVALIVPDSKLGTAYGLMTMIQNIGLFAFNVIIGWLNDHFGASQVNPAGYHAGMWVFSLLGFAGIFFSLMLFKSNKRDYEAGISQNLESATK